MSRLILVSLGVLFIITLLLSGCNHKTSEVNYKNLITEEESSCLQQEIELPKLNDRLMDQYLQKKAADVEFFKLKTSKIDFKFSKDTLIPVESGQGTSNLILYNLYGQNSSNHNYVVIGIYKWENYPYAKEDLLDRFIFKIDFETPVVKHEAVVSYNANYFKSIPLALYNKGYIWDIQKNAKNLPGTGAIYIELTDKSIQSSWFEYRYNSSPNYFKDKKENTSVVTIENKINL